MKVIKIVILTLLITFLLFAASVYITFKYILTPERIKNYVRTYVERTIDEQFEKYKKELLDKISFSGFSSDKEQETENKDDKKPDENIESVEVLESVESRRGDEPALAHRNRDELLYQCQYRRRLHGCHPELARRGRFLFLGMAIQPSFGPIV